MWHLSYRTLLLFTSDVTPKMVGDFAMTISKYVKNVHRIIQVEMRNPGVFTMPMK